MKMFLKIIKYRFLSILKHPAVLVCLAGAMVCSSLVAVFAENKEDADFEYPIAIVNEDGGEFSELFIEYMKENSQLKIEIMERSSAISQVSTGKLDGAFIILRGFSEKIEEGDIEDLVEFVSPSVTTSAYPVSEIVSAGIVDLWLKELSENKISAAYKEYEGTPEVSIDEIKEKINSEYSTEDIISIEYIGDYKIQETAAITPPVDKAVGIFASFIIFAIMLSSEWIFNFKNKSLQDRFTSNNSSMFAFYLGTQAASVLVCMLFFVPILIFLTIYLNIAILYSIYIFIGFLIFSLGICAISFIISTVVRNLTELIVLGVSIGIANILLSALVTDNMSNNVIVNAVSKILPGTYLKGCYLHPSQIFYSLIVSIIWVAAGYVLATSIKKREKSFS